MVLLPLTLFFDMVDDLKVACVGRLWTLMLDGLESPWWQSLDLYKWIGCICQPDGTGLSKSSNNFRKVLVVHVFVVFCNASN